MIQRPWPLILLLQVDVKIRRACLGVQGSAIYVSSACLISLLTRRTPLFYQTWVQYYFGVGSLPDCHELNGNCLAAQNTFRVRLNIGGANQYLEKGAFKRSNLK
jgi:hypothetical protein